MVDVATKQTTAGTRPSFREELAGVWRELPNRGAFLILLGAWVLLFQVLGNSTLGYVDTSSLFGWLNYAYRSSSDDDHGYLIPLVVLGLLWWKRRELVAVPKRAWWPGLVLLGFALVLHLLGFLIQQTRISVVAFFVGLYAVMGLVWGLAWLRATFFPFFLFAFCVPLATLSEPITFPLRLLATHITGWLSQGILGINVICDGTRIFEPNGAYQYEVAAACSGIRSMTATLALSLVYGFVAFSSWWKRLVMVVAAFPLAVLANVVRLTMIIVASAAFGESTGKNVHASTWMSLLPYVPALGGVFLLGAWLRKTSPDRKEEPAGAIRPALQS